LFSLESNRLLKFEIQSTKFETNSNVQKGNDKNSFGRDLRRMSGVLVIQSFELVSDFDIRISDLSM